MSLINEHLKELVADSFILYMKSLHTHWNMKDERFYFLHKMIEEQHNELSSFIDTLAERIRQKGDFAPKSLKEMLKLATVAEEDKIKNGQLMLNSLRKSYEAVISKVHKHIQTAGKANDLVTQDILIEYARFIEKTIWIIESHQK
jgi:starvation-inducible DNA-binding protein